MAVWTPEMEEYLANNVKYYGNGVLRDIINEKFGTELSITDIEDKKREKGFFHGHSVEKYTRPVREFVFKNISGHTNKELAEMCEKEFGIHFSEASIQNFKSKNNLASRGKGNYNRLFTPEQEKFVRYNYKLNTNAMLTAKLNEKFGTDFTELQVGSWKIRHGLKSGLWGKFAVGMLGEERQQGDYMMIKVGTGRGARNWKCSHQLLWESVYGPIPKNKVLIFLDGDHKNVTIENLALIDKAIQMELARGQFFAIDKELTKAAIGISKLNVAIRARRREEGLFLKRKKPERKRPPKESQLFGKFTPEIQEYINDIFGIVPTYEISDLIYDRFGVRIGRSYIQKFITVTGISGQTEWTDDINARLTELWPDHTAAECSRILNSEFGVSVGFTAVTSHAAWLGLKKLNPKNRMTPEIEQFLRENADKYSNPELTRMINEKFGTEFNDISTYKSKFGLVEHIDPGYAEKSYKLYKRLDFLRGSEAPEIEELKAEAQEMISKITSSIIQKEMEMRYIQDMSWDGIADANASGGNLAQTSCASRKRVSRYVERLGRAIRNDSK